MSEVFIMSNQIFSLFVPLGFAGASVYEKKTDVLLSVNILDGRWKNGNLRLDLFTVVEEYNRQ